MADRDPFSETEPVNGLARAANIAARPLSQLAKVSNALGTLTVLALVVLVNSDVVSRNLFNAPFQGTYEMVQFSMTFIVFLQLPDVVRTNRLTRSDGFLAVIAGKKPGIARVIARLIDGMSAVFMLVILYAMIPEFLRSWEHQNFFGTPGIFTAPYWPLNLVICFSAALSALVFAAKAIAGKRRPEHLHLERSGA